MRIETTLPIPLPLKTVVNRQNSLKSTGPRSLEGKNRVKWNPLKHGILSKEVVIGVGCGKEKKAEYDKILARLCLELQPVGILEELMVERIAVSYWRLRRVLVAESGEIRKRLDNVLWEEVYRLRHEFHEDRNYAVLDRFRSTFEKTSAGRQFQLEAIDEAKEEVAEKGYISNDTRSRLVEAFGTQRDSLTVTCEVFNAFAKDALGIEPLADSEKLDSGEPMTAERAKGILLKILSDRAKDLEYLKDVAHQSEDLHLDAHTRSLALPPPQECEKLLGYESRIEGQLYRAMNELDKLQRRRLGQPMPPTINIDLFDNRSEG